MNVRPTTPLERRLAEVILAVGANPFSIDDVTHCGELVLDAERRPNSTQGGIGALFRHASQRNLIEPTGTVVTSCSPARKGGTTRQWQATEAGRLWAANA